MRARCIARAVPIAPAPKTVVLATPGRITRAGTAEARGDDA